MIFKEDAGTGYMYSYAPQHPCANAAGKVMEHTFVYYNHTGEIVSGDFCIHHIDRNKKNNKFSNLLKLTTIEHQILHAIEDRNTVYAKKMCPSCFKEWEAPKSDDRIFCSVQCVAKGSMRFDVDQQTLRRLVWSMPTTKVAQMFNVSDVAIAKRCKKYGIAKPPRGYWS
jgi:hypothetical protein